MRTKLDRIHDLLNLKSMLLSSLLARTNDRENSRVVLTENERDLKNLIDKVTKELKDNENRCRMADAVQNETNSTFEDKTKIT